MVKDHTFALFNFWTLPLCVDTSNINAKDKQKYIKVSAINIWNNDMFKMSKLIKNKQYFYSPSLKMLKCCHLMICISIALQYCHFSAEKTKLDKTLLICGIFKFLESTPLNKNMNMFQSPY